MQPSARPFPLGREPHTFQTAMPSAHTWGTGGAHLRTVKVLFVLSAAMIGSTVVSFRLEFSSLYTHAHTVGKQEIGARVRVSDGGNWLAGFTLEKKKKGAGGKDIPP